MGPNPEPVAPIVLKGFRTDETAGRDDPRTIYHWDTTPRDGNWYVVEVTEVHDTPGQETDTASEHEASQSYHIPANLGENPPTPASGLAIDSLPAPEQDHFDFTHYLESQLDATNEGNWAYSSDLQQTNDFMSYHV